jgi:hypothetical protein
MRYRLGTAGRLSGTEGIGAYYYYASNNNVVLGFGAVPDAEYRGRAGDNNLICGDGIGVFDHRRWQHGL